MRRDCIATVLRRFRRRRNGYEESVEQILRKNRGGFVKDSNGFPVIVGGKSGGYLAFGPPKRLLRFQKLQRGSTRGRRNLV